ncbi:MAG: hypothetical protein IJ106_07975 [Parasporobacterium sp.]|nr:hypothetical protein [Parasporobacterium sp.]
MLQLFGSRCRKSHALLQFFVKEALSGAFLPKNSRNAAFFRQNPGLSEGSAENLTQCCNFSAGAVKNIEHCGTRSLTGRAEASKTKDIQKPGH